MLILFRLECLTRLSLGCTLAVSECVGSISHILENMLLVSGKLDKS